ncbi:terminase small subunit [Lutimaribacter sp. EGI FJ00014]|nr:terminase small subunit [Lutimaribacter sp. EGI FJ00014]
MTPKQKKFVEAYTQIGAATYGNAARSAEVAGYKGCFRQVGAENLAKPDIVAAVSERMDRVSKCADLTVEGVLRDIAGCLKGAMDAEQWSACAQFLKMQAQYLRMFDAPVQDDLSRLSEAELDKLLEEARRENDAYTHMKK